MHFLSNRDYFLRLMVLLLIFIQKSKKSEYKVCC